MARQSWWDEHRGQLGTWASRLEASAANRSDRTAYLRRAGRYVLWCVENGHDPAQRDNDLVDEWLGVIRKHEDQGNLKESTKRAVRACIAHWHGWLEL